MHICSLGDFLLHVKEFTSTFQIYSRYFFAVFQDAHLLHMVKAFECVSSIFIEMKSLTALQREFAGSVGAQMPFGSYAIKQKSQTGNYSAEVCLISSDQSFIDIKESCMWR